MKTLSKIISAMFVFMMMIGVCKAVEAAEAASAESVENAQELSSIKRLAIYYPDYYHYSEYKEEPADANAFMKMLFDASKVSRSYIISYDEIAEKIKTDSGVDIKSMSKQEARKVFKEQISKYADAYLYVTMVNTNRLNMFFSIYLASNNEKVYDLQLQAGKNDDEKTTKKYQAMSEQFFKAFDKAAQDSTKKSSSSKKNDKSEKKSDKSDNKK